MAISKEFLEAVDKILFETLINAKNIMPKRLAKFVACYYPDAAIRKEYSHFIGLSMGERTYANLGLKIIPSEEEICVEIGDHVSIGPNATFICQSAANNGTEINELPYVRETLTKSGKITIEDNAWLGASVTIMPCVTVGRCAVIGAGSIVFGDVESYSVYAGVPARKIRDLRTGERV